MRLFLAINLGREVREQIHRDTAVLREAVPTVSWVRAELLHITMKFLGEVSEAALAPLVAAGREAVGRHGAFTLELRGIGAFPSLHRPRVVWLGAVESRAAVGLARDIEGACTSLGFPPEAREFNPHVTLGRAKTPLDPTARRALSEAARDAGDAYRLAVHAVEVMRSELSPQGSRYAVMASLPLRPA